MSRSRFALTALAVLATTAAAAPAAAEPAAVSIRAEGIDATVIGSRTVTTDARVLVDAAGSHDLPSPSVLTALIDASAASGVPFTCSWAFGPCFVDSIGAPFAPGATLFWRVVVNDIDASVGAGERLVATGDRVALVATDYLAAQPPLLELAVTTERTPLGGSFVATVTSFDTSDPTGTKPAPTGTPAAGALVRYGAQAGITNAAGQVGFLATEAGNQAVLATLAGATRSNGVSVCAFGADPTVCNLPPLAPTTQPATPTATATPVALAKTDATDVVAPSSRISAPRLWSKVRGVTRLAGSVAPDRSDIARVEVALARRVGTLCRFRTATGTWGAARACTDRTWLHARGGAFWTYSLQAPLAAGRYRVFARATDGAGNVERTLVTGASSGSFTVVR
jgi:hypothetical protein